MREQYLTFSRNSHILTNYYPNLASKIKLKMIFSFKTNKKYLIKSRLTMRR